MFTKMPDSTEQILHPDKATEAPVAVTLPADLAASLGSGWTVPLQDTFGELQLGIWLREGGVPSAEATDAAAGWGGDRLAVIEGPDGAWAVVDADRLGHRSRRRRLRDRRDDRAREVARRRPGPARGRRQDPLGAHRLRRGDRVQGRRA